ncbi:MAG: hypothetical protein H6510_10675 [Acidobacteria bacterium]|nr:hypothetical protein [Acidobacteriota bacterium]MCB9398274.1 hypothetical protein [Acidobacteriota bacterium]
MRNSLKLLIVVALGLLGYLHAQEVRAQFDIQFRVNYTDLYLFRGHVYDEEPGVQGDLLLGVGAWSYSVFHHPGYETEKLDEFVHALEYTTIGRGTVQTLGYRFYQYGFGRPDSQELFYRIRQRTAWNPTYGIAYDIDAYRGTYIDLNLSRAFPLTAKTDIGLTLKAGGSYGLEPKVTRSGEVIEAGFYEKDGLAHASVAVDFTRPMGKHLSLRASYEYHQAFDDLLKEDPKTGKTNQNWQVSLKLKTR